MRRNSNATNFLFNNRFSHFYFAGEKKAQKFASHSVKIGSAKEGGQSDK